MAPSASVVGEVQIGEKSSVWYGCVLRGNLSPFSMLSVDLFSHSRQCFVCLYTSDFYVLPPLQYREISGLIKEVVWKISNVHFCTFRVMFLVVTNDGISLDFRQCKTQ